MATPKDNTEVVRMLRDFKNAVYRSGTSSKSISPNLIAGFDPARFRANLRADTSSIATKLNFSNLDESAVIRTSNTSTILGNERQTPANMKRKLASLEIELQTTRAALKKKEGVISLLEPANKKACLDLEQKLMSTTKKSELDRENILQLQTQLKFSQSEAAQLKNRVRECEKEKKIACDKLEMKLLALQREGSDLKLDLSQEKSEKAETVRRLNSEIGRLELKLTSISQEARLSKDLVQSLKKQINELTEKANQSIKTREDLNAAQAHIKSLQDQIEAGKDAALVVQAMQSELKSIPDLQKENQVLKEEVRKYKDSNVALFQEKMWAFQEKSNDMEKKNVTIAKLEAEKERLVSKISEWQALFDDSGTPGSRSPSAFSRRLSHYQKSEALLTNKVSKLSAYCESLEKQKKNFEASVQQMTTSFEAMKQSAGSNENIVKRLRQRIQLLTKERDNGRRLIDSYVNETTISGTTLNTTNTKFLETTITEYQQSLEKADKDIERLEQEVQVLSEKLKVSEENESVVKQQQEEKAELLVKIEELEEEKSDLQEIVSSSSKQKLEKSEKIIHLKSNPLDVAVRKHAEEFVNLRTENDRLRKRVQVLEEEGASSSDVTLKVEEKLIKEGSDTLLQSLRDQLTSAERQNKLILDTARTKSREFREAIYSLTGYKVDVPVSGKYKLSHVYADSPDEHLLFAVNSRGVQLLETEYSSQLADRIETYLQTYDSVPAFLASVTLDLFNQQTYLAQQSMS